MSYHQITSDERYRLSALRVQGHGTTSIAREMGRHRSTVWREVRRNAHVDGHYTCRRPSSTPMLGGGDHAAILASVPSSLHPVWKLLGRLWSPQQICGYLRRSGQLCISHETL